MSELNEEYKLQAMLAVKILPLLASHPEFALKGGTAINYFFRPFPRLSVDIDLTFMPVLSRELSLEMISDSLNMLTDEIFAKYPDVSIHPKKLQGKTAALRITQGSTSIKIEPNLVIRGSVYPPIQKNIVQEAENELGHFSSVRCLSFADIYGGKICAALDRQHPRDLFDIKVLLENEGITDEVRQAFIVYLISHSRPMAEILAPNLLILDDIFMNEFSGTTRISVRLEDLVNARQQLIAALHAQLTEKERRFIFSIKMGDPEWYLFPIRHIEDLPAVQWKLQNIKRMTRTKHTAAIEKLKKVLDL